MTEPLDLKQYRGQLGPPPADVQSSADEVVCWHDYVLNGDGFPVFCMVLK